MKSTRILAFALAGLGLSAGAQAQTTPNEWELELTPYLWAMGVKGTVSVGPKEAEVSASFKDLLESLDFAAMGKFEARRGSWSLSTDLLYSDLGKTATLAGPLGGASGEFVADLEMLIAEADAGYRIGGGPVEVFAGARLFSTNARIDGPQQTLAEGGATWVDPLVGLRFRKWLGKWQVALQGDIGGFGAGSDFSWGAQAALGYRVSHTVSLHATYSALSFDYEGGREIGKLDSTLGGFGLAATIRF